MHPLSRAESPFHALKVSLATQPPANQSRRRPSAPKGTQSVAFEQRNFAKTLRTESFDRNGSDGPTLGVVPYPSKGIQTL